MAKITIIEAPHVWKTRLNECVGKCEFESASSFVRPYIASCYMVGRKSADYLLIINGREYSWPGDGFAARGLYISQIEAHIKECIKIDEAFYGTGN